MAKPEWWDDTELKKLSARVVRTAPNYSQANRMRAIVLCGRQGAWRAGPRSAAELKEAAAHYERCAALCNAPAGRDEFAKLVDLCHSYAARATIVPVVSLVLSMLMLGAAWWCGGVELSSCGVMCVGCVITLYML